MHTVQVPIAGVDNTVTRPVILSIVEQIKTLSRMNIDVESLYKSTLDELQESNSNIEDLDNNEITPKETALSIEVTETYPEDSYATTAVNYPEHREIFLDKDSRIFLKPVYVDSEVTIDFTYKHRSKTKINEWISNMRVRVSQTMDVNYHSLKYKYILPAPIMDLLIEVYNLRESIAGYGIPIEDYIRDSSDGRLTILSDLAGKDLELAASETQIRVQGFYDFEASPDKIETDKDYYYVSFSYKFSYQKPLAIQAVYPTTVHNQLLDRRFIVDIDLIQDRPGYGVDRDVYLNSLKDRELQFSLYHNENTGILTIPVYDKWIPPLPIKYTARIASVLITITEEDRRTLLNLNELGDIELDSTILQWISDSELTHIFKLYDSFIHIGLYKNNNTLMYVDNLEITNDLTIKSKIDLDLRGEYRVVISLVVDTSSLPETVLKRTMTDINVLVKLLDSINIRIEFDKVLGSKEITYIDQVTEMNNLELLKLLRGMVRPAGDYRTVMKTVQTASIFAIKK